MGNGKVRENIKRKKESKNQVAAAILWKKGVKLESNFCKQAVWLFLKYGHKVVSHKSWNIILRSLQVTKAGFLNMFRFTEHFS